ncbi:hypothetical protein DAEQUDRAFT_754440 [Daedalea quercina L-15889]|uniref:Uncharacterized protein n=1 Tax=Daedalea quercina L-15889 TaxID=1314783 RepID=A0A165TLF7_9APHY|nr:hypothetical protein DAEQUDRAFT_754440 [Daedalea quercina L-15889]
MGLEDEIIQDSEDEEMSLRIPGPSIMPTEARGAAKDKQPSTSHGASTTVQNDRSAGPSAVQTPPVAAPTVSSTRPRPRPAYNSALAKAAAAATGTNGEASASIVPAGPDTTRLTNPPVANSSSSSVVISPPATSTYPPPTEDADMFSLDIAERAKLRSRARSSKATAAQPALPTDADIIDITSSSDDDFNIRPPPRGSKSKTVAKDLPSPKKRAKKTHTPFDPTLDDTSSAVLPIATSDLSSQLPPSDPPPPSTPLKSTPANARPQATISSSPLSSPLPKPPRPPKRKRKTIPAQLDGSDDDGGIGHRGMLRKEDSGLAMPPPPPPFFADPSSSSAPASDTLVETSSPTRASDGPHATKSAKTKAKRKAVDDDDFEDEWPAEPPPKPKPRQRRKPADEDDWQGDDAPKPARKSRKKAADEDEEEWAGDAPPKRKPRAPPKRKGKKDQVLKQVVEVVIERSPTKGRKGRAGKKDAQPLSVEDVATRQLGDTREGASAISGDADTSKGDLSPLSDAENKSGKGSAPPATPPPTSPKSAVPVLRNSESILNSPRSKSKSKGKKRAVVDSDEEENDGGEREQLGSPPKKPRREPRKGRESAPAALELGIEDQDDNEPESSHKEGPRPRISSYSVVTAPFKSPLPAPGTTPKLTMTHRSYTIGGGRSSQLPMSELLKKVNSQPGSPFASPRPTYSPYAKASKSLLRKIAPLHPNRRTPPPPPPRPPPPKKSKKQLELEEKWEMELEESVEGWYCMSEEERAALRRAKRDAEMGFED